MSDVPGDDDSTDLGFTYRLKKDGAVAIHHRGRLAATLRGELAAEFVDEVRQGDASSQQQWMARITGNYKHGNERTAGAHPRNRR